MWNAKWMLPSASSMLKDGYKLVETSGDSKKESSEAKLLETLTAWAWQNSGLLPRKKGLSGYSSLSKEELLGVLKG